MSDRHTVITSSDDFKAFFPNNSQDHFIYLFNKAIDLPGEWTAELNQIYIELENPTQTDEPIIVDVFLTQVSGVILRGHESRLLSRVIFFPQNGANILSCDIPEPTIVCLRLPQIDRLEFFIKPVHPKILAFKGDGTACATLNIVRRR
jgi:hypothetical protein